MEFLILGPLEVWGGGRPIELTGGAKQRALLAMLLIHVGSVLSRDRLIDALWGDEAPATAENGLQVYVSALRKTLRQAGRDGPATDDVLLTQRPGYVLRLDPDRIDARRFERMATDGARALRSGRIDDAAEQLREALTLWRGGALVEFSYEPFAQQEIERLEELRVSALEDRIEADLALGRHRELIGEIDALVAQWPLRERLRAHFMLALYRSGRQAESLEAYRDARETLADELGIDPSPALRRLESAILEQDASLEPPVREPPVLESPSKRPGPERPVPELVIREEPVRIETPAAGPRQPSSLPLRERKTVSVLFCDLVDSTKSGDGADPEDIDARLDPYHTVVRSQLERYGGTFEKFEGDAVMGVFGAPIAHEDDPERAVRAGLRILEAIETLNEVHPGADFKVRVAIETGLALVSLQARPELGESFVKGDVVNTAARLQGKASIGTLLVGIGTYTATKESFLFEELTPVTLRGKVEPVARFLVISTRSHPPKAPRQYSSPFVGREVERELLRAICSRSIRDSSFQLVTVSGEPGIGKTRLVADLFAYIDEHPQLLVRWRKGKCLPYGDGITFWALGEIVKAQAGIVITDDPDTVRLKLERELPPLDEADRDWLLQRLMPLVGLGIEPGVERAESFTAWRRFLEHLAETRPTVLVFEDLHWADAALIAFMEHLVQHAGAVPLTVVATTRPELYERHPLFGATVPNATRIDLAPLTDDETRELVDGLLEGRGLPDADRDLIAHRSGGVPLFIEEFVRLLKERGVLRRVGSGWRLEGDEVPLPSGIAALIASRLDALPAERKALLAVAAVVGEVFWSGAVAHASGVDRGTVEQALHQISRMELVRRSRTSSMGAETEYRFWHALVRDVAYGQIPRVPRAEKHLAVAEWIEGVAGDRIEDLAEIMASHYTEAIRLFIASRQSDRAERCTDDAVRYLTLAGDRAMALDAMRAETHYRQALSLMSPDHLNRAALLGKAAEATHVSGRIRDAAELYEQAIASSQELGQAAVTADLTIRYVVVLAGLGQEQRSLALLNRLIDELERKGPSPQLARAYAERAQPFLGLPYQYSLAQSEKALALADQLDLPAVRARALDFRGGGRVALGDPAGLDDIRAALRLSLELRLIRPASVTYVNLVALMTYEDPANALEVADEGLRYGAERGLAEGEAWIRAYRLQAMFQLGEWGDLISSSEQICEWAERYGHERNEIVAAYPKALALMTMGRVSEAARLARHYRDRASTMQVGELFDLPIIAELTSSGKTTKAAEAIDAMLKVFEVDANGLLEQSCETARHSVAVGRADFLQRIEGMLAGELALARNARGVCDALVAECEGRHREALAAFTRAEAAWHAFRNPYERGHARLGQARCLLALSRPTEASERAQMALEVFQGLHAAPAAKEASAIIAISGA